MLFFNLHHPRRVVSVIASALLPLITCCGALSSPSIMNQAGASSVSQDSLIGSWSACEVIDKNGDGIFDKDDDWSLLHRVTFTESNFSRTASSFAMSLNCSGFNYADNELRMEYRSPDCVSAVSESHKLDFAAFNAEIVTIYSEATVAFYNNLDIGDDDFVGAYGKTNWKKGVPMDVTGIRFEGVPFKPSPEYSIFKIIEGYLFFGKPATESSDDDGSSVAQRHSLIDTSLQFTKAH